MMFQKMKSLRKINSVILAVLLIYVMIIMLPSSSADEPDVSISIGPVSQTVDSDETFNVNVSCVPSRPIKAFEFKISFDASLLKANSVSIGDIFDGYMTFFNPGTIDNIAGSIIHIYGLIIGVGNVSDARSFVNISFTAKSKSGVSQLHLDSVGVCDENGYLSIVVTDGSVTIRGSSNPPSNPSSNSPDDTEHNNPPDSSLELFGPIFVEKGVENGYLCFTRDPDEDSIRYRFDWGDGTLSSWSDLVISSMNASFYHSWETFGNFQVCAIAQDEHGLNSSWSVFHNVTVSIVAGGNQPPVGIFNVSGYFIINKTMVFNASGSFDTDGMIVSYFWDFGDGINSTGESVTHTYSKPGSYEVNLVVIDNSGNIFSKSMYFSIVGIYVDQEKIPEKQVMPGISLTLLVVLIVSVVMFCLIIFFRKSIKYFVLSYVVGLFSRIKLSYSNYEIKRLEAKKQKILFRINNLLIKSNRTTVVKRVPSNFVTRVYNNLQEVNVKTDQPVNFHLNNSSNKFDKRHTSVTIDNFFYNQKAEVEYHIKVDSLFEDINDKVDRLLLSADSKIISVKSDVFYSGNHYI